jgi:hypothetical protein
VVQRQNQCQLHARLLGADTPKIFTYIKARHVNSGGHSPYDILGVTPEIGNDALKIHYRKLIADNHPDKMIARGFRQNLWPWRPRRSPPSTRPMRRSLKNAVSDPTTNARRRTKFSPEDPPLRLIRPEGLDRSAPSPQLTSVQF